MYNVYCNCCFYMQSEHSPLINTLHQMNYNSFVEAIIHGGHFKFRENLEKSHAHLHIAGNVIVKIK